MLNKGAEGRKDAYLFRPKGLFGRKVRGISWREVGWIFKSKAVINAEREGWAGPPCHSQSGLFPSVRHACKVTGITPTEQDG